MSKYEWDENKNQSNIKKHGVDFNDAKKVFKDKKHKVSPDLRKDYGENRFKIIGQIYRTLISVIFTMRKQTKRLISARTASKKEKQEYENN